MAFQKKLARILRPARFVMVIRRSFILSSSSSAYIPPQWLPLSRRQARKFRDSKYSVIHFPGQAESKPALQNHPIDLTLSNFSDSRIHVAFEFQPHRPPHREIKMAFRLKLTFQFSCHFKSESRILLRLTSASRTSPRSTTAAKVKPSRSEPDSPHGMNTKNQLSLEKGCSSSFT